MFTIWTRADVHPAVRRTLPPNRHIHTYNPQWSGSSWEGNNTGRKTGSGVCFLSFTPPTPSSPSLLRCYTSLRILSVDLHCSGCRGQSSWHINAAFSNKPPHSPVPVLGTQWNTYFSSFLSFVFLLTAARRLVAAVLNLSQGILAVFFFFFHLSFPRRDLGPDAKSTTGPTSIPPSSLHSATDKPPSFYPGGDGTRHCTETGHI